MAFEIAYKKMEKLEGKNNVKLVCNGRWYTVMIIIFLYGIAEEEDVGIK